MGTRLRDIAHESMDITAQVNAIMSEMLNIGRVLLVKLFGRTEQEIERFRDRATRVREMSVLRSIVGGRFSMLLGLMGAVGTAIIYWGGGTWCCVGSSPSAPSGSSAPIYTACTARFRR